MNSIDMISIDEDHRMFDGSRVSKRDLRSAVASNKSRSTKPPKQFSKIHSSMGLGVGRADRVDRREKIL